jgi:predicted nuclease with TOPRIM domain
MGLLKEQMDKFGRDLQTFPESQEYKDLKKSLEELAAEIERKEKQTREQIKREWLPKIQRELDELRQRLKQMGREDEMAPLDREVERIRRI